MNTVNESRVRSFKILMILFWAFICISVLVVSLPNNVVSPLYKKNRFSIFTFYPQGWGFFTRSPRLPIDVYLIKENGKWIADPRLKSGTFYNLFGLDRTGRVANGAYQKIHFEVAKSKWNFCKDYQMKDYSFLSDTISTVNVKIKKVPGLQMPSDLIIVSKAITPYAYKDFENRTGLPVSFIKLKIAYY
jgi:antimicrobial peptide system SdpA family protein